MASRRGKKIADIMPPTPEQMSAGQFSVEPITDRQPGGRFVTIGSAYRRRPMIDVLYAAGTFTESQHRALRHFRHHYDMIDCSPTTDSLCIERGGGCGEGHSFSALNAAYIAGACERAAGSLADILRAVVIYDQSLSQWAMEKYGAVERRRQHRGKTISVLEPPRKALDIVRLEIRMAAKRVEAELAA